MTSKEYQQASALVEKYQSGTSTEQENAWIEQWYLKLNAEPIDLNEEEAIGDLLDLQSRLASIAEEKQKKKFKRQTFAAAAAIFIILGAGLVWKAQLDKQYQNQEKTKNQNSLAIAEQIHPGTNRAILSLDGGDEIELSVEQAGLISTGNSISYEDGTSIQTLAKQQNATLRTPAAGQYQVTLPDGTKAWLNASSSITYPTSFEEEIRTISIQGEVYLDVAKNPNKPFIVLFDDQKVEVLGTSFNIDAYGDQGKYSTTLVEGSLRISNTKSKESILLKPGEQAINSEKGTFTTRKVDTQDYSSWKDGIYIVNDQSLYKLGKQIERWYDVEVDMGKYKDIKLSAIIRRDVRLAEVLEAIELKTELSFTIKRRRVSVN